MRSLGTYLDGQHELHFALELFLVIRHLLFCALLHEITLDVYWVDTDRETSLEGRETVSGGEYQSPDPRNRLTTSSHGMRKRHLE